ncbi:MAG: UTP--glucose-1-phosphate uridylyltransferase [Crocinitomicaceae bacterium]|nr:UTP--glucose-1-phosphate uridylyltransferase [Crocinitomicaceae bacterium]|tara:strand:- start:1121 stop:2020 length:900 start_codon:yes stop_codon:yes gene_type:complete
MKKLRKAIIPVAGLGTRMLPATKVIPKEMLPIIEKPIIQYVVEEVIEAGFKDIIFVTHSSKNSIENHFDRSFELESTLEKRVKRSLLKEIKSISKLKVNISSIRQPEALGLGHAILQAKDIIEDEPFAVILPDRVMNPYKQDAKKKNLSFMKLEFEKLQSSLILFEKVSKKEVANYGIAKLSKSNNKNLMLLDDIVEKPSIKNAPSSYAVVGRYIFTSEIFNELETITKLKKDTSKEIELTDAIKGLLKKKKSVFAAFLKGDCFDCGNPIGYFKSIVEVAGSHPELKTEFRRILSRALK